MEKILPFQFIKKSPLYGSFQGMNYRITEMDGKLQACVFPGPFAFEHTPEEKKEYAYFEFSDAGYEEALRYLDESYQAKDWRDEQIPFDSVS